MNASEALKALHELQRWDIGYTQFGACIQRKPNGTYVKLEDVEAILTPKRPLDTLDME